MNFSDGSRGWGKSEAGEGVLREDGRLRVGRRDRNACPSTLEQQRAPLSSFLKRATAPRLSCKGAINLPRREVITLMDTGRAEHLISTRAFYVLAPSLYTTASFPQTAPRPLVRNRPSLIPRPPAANEVFLEITGLSPQGSVGGSHTGDRPPAPTSHTLFCTVRS